MKQRVRLYFTFFLLLQLHFLSAQQTDSLQAPPPEDWFLRDPAKDSLQGVSIERTYNELLQNKPSRTILVAVIDSGIDIEHEDLTDVIWTNEDEISGNGIDDDKNGYTDDVHGWNFIGGKSGNVSHDTYEVTREYARLKPKYENADPKKISKKEKKEYEYWLEVKKKYDNDSKAAMDQLEQYKQHYGMYVNMYQTISFCDSVLEKFIGKPVLKSTLSEITSENDTINFAKNTLSRITEQMEGDVPVKELIVELNAALDQLQKGVEHFRTAVEFGYNTEFNPRSIVGDDPGNPYEKGYGNNDVEGPDAHHGTHVAGIIAANRKNDLGINGVADNVKIMPVRAVPNGDERDKDVANAIIYAVDNGAHIINMSFGKGFSPQKEVVDKAAKYAASKGVLLLHAAGNDDDNNDVDGNYPNKFLKKGEVKTWMEIGASSFKTGEDLVAPFSNYGKKSVDMFAPGVEIFSTMPDNEYELQQGTSMACPVATGVAAVLMSYFPELSAMDVKEILRQSTRRFDSLQVTKPGTEDELVPFSDLSSTGGIVNAYEAVKLAMKWDNNKSARR